MANNEILNPLCGAKPLSSSAMRLSLLAAILGLSACASAPKVSHTAPATPAEQATPDDALMSEIMAAELALKEERNEEAAIAYSAAALRSPDVQVAERATRVAVFAKRYDLVQLGARRWLELDANAVLARQALASSAIHQGDEKAAFDQLKILLAGSAPSKERWQLVGQALVGHLESKHTQPVFERLLKDPAAGSDIDSRLSQAQLASVLGLPDRAQALADQAVAENPGSERALIFRGQMKLEREQIDAGLADYAAASALLPKDKTLKMGYAALLARYARFNEADSVLSKMVQDQDVLLARAAYAQEAKQTDKAIGFYRKLAALKVENRAEHAFKLGQLAESLQLNDEALAWYRQVDLGESVGEARIREAAVLNSSKRSLEALALLSRLQTESEDPQTIEAAYLLEAEIANQRKDDKAEFGTLDRGLAALSNSPRLLYARGLKLVEAGRLDDAERDFRRIIGLDPQAGYALNALGFSLADLTTRYTEARGYIERALKLTPDEPAVIDSMGWVEFKLGNTAKALEYLSRAYTMNPDPEIAAHYAEVLAASGDRAKSEQVLRDALSKTPDNEALKKTAQRLK